MVVVIKRTIGNMVVMIITNITLVNCCVSESVLSSSHIKSILKLLLRYLPFLSSYSFIMV